MNTESNKIDGMLTHAENAILVIDMENDFVFPGCVRSTAVDSMGLDYITTVVTDCCSAATEEVAKANIYAMQNMGIPCVPSSDIMK